MIGSKRLFSTHSSSILDQCTVTVIKWNEMLKRKPWNRYDSYSDFGCMCAVRLSELERKGVWNLWIVYTTESKIVEVGKRLKESEASEHQLRARSTTPRLSWPQLPKVLHKKLEKKKGTKEEWGRGRRRRSWRNFFFTCLQSNSQKKRGEGGGKKTTEQTVLKCRWGWIIFV